MQILKHLEWLKLYRSLVISGVANGAIKQILAFKEENDRLTAQNDRMLSVLNNIAAWDDGEEVDCSFDEPSSSRKARKVLAELGSVTEL